MSEIKIYKTTDLYLAAFLKLKGQKLSVEKNKGKAIFSFGENDELTKLVNDYLTEEGTCNPLSYTNSIKNLKNLIYNL
jgi:hypothetical protein|tara:strand:+ start:1425 stop:1658 length:234 start_codon:yes stop_codon:yes gene_type:complete